MRATIKSMARELGISHMTVSRALSGSEHVNARTRERVLAHAEAVGYVRSSAAGAMRGEPTAIVGLLLPNIVNDFYAQLANALGVLCAEADLDLVIHLTGDELRREIQCLTRLHALQARAVLRVPAPRIEGHAPPGLPDLPVINLIRRVEDEPRVADLLVDDRQAIALAVRALADRGRKRLAYIGGAETLSTGRVRLQAFRDALSDHGIDCLPELIHTGQPGWQMGKRCMCQLLDATSLRGTVPGMAPEALREVVSEAVPGSVSASPSATASATASAPDGLVCGGFEIANGALDECLARGLRLPQELAFVGYGDAPFHRWLAGGISTISLSAQSVAELAMGLIKQAGQNATSNPVVHRIRADYVSRQSA